MALQCSIATTVGGTRTLAKMAMGTGYFCVNFVSSAPTVEIIRHHIRGVAGNITVRDARSGKVFTIEMLYCDTTDVAVYTTFDADKNNWATQAATIVDPAGVSWVNCNLIPGSIRILRYGTDGAGKGELLASAQFMFDS